MGYQLIDNVADTVSITVDGQSVQVPAGRSLLAGMATAGLAPAFFCAIGQCQRCTVWINGHEDIACLTVPQEGDEIQTSLGSWD